MWFNPNSRGSRLRIWQPWGCKSLHAHHLAATGFSGNSRPRRLKIAEPSGCKSRVADQFNEEFGVHNTEYSAFVAPACGSPGIADRFGSNPNSLGSASLPTPTNSFPRPRPRPRISSLGVEHEDENDLSGMSTGRASRACLLNSACLRASGASPRHSAILWLMANG